MCLSAKSFGGEQRVIYTKGGVDMSSFSGATLLITGGTGAFGHTVLKHFLHTDIG